MRLTAMTPPIATDGGLLYEHKQRRAFHPHLVCSWNIDPASRRLSCVWTELTDAGADGADRTHAVH
jgi:hypothetical protein